MYGYMLVRVAKSGASPGETATISLLHEFSQSLKTGWRAVRDEGGHYCYAIAL
ncbi:hypothetical protein [Hyphomonas sp.]|uniref:hypothetical protein n=1 Tax=Hyphomonas sp. TaxID=87 RepID=UPI0025BECBD1|nr:hypothetical protein [Hyphomonas sp.]